MQRKRILLVDDSRTILLVTKPIDGAELLAKVRRHLGE
jgi:hypothetical protein